MQLYSEKLRCFYQIVSHSRKSRETVKNKVIKATDTICKIFEAVWTVKLLSITSILLNTVKLWTLYVEKGPSLKSLFCIYGGCKK